MFAKVPGQIDIEQAIAGWLEEFAAALIEGVALFGLVICIILAFK